MMPLEKKRKYIMTISSQLTTIIENRRKSVIRLMVLKNSLFDMWNRATVKLVAEKEINELLDKVNHTLNEKEVIDPNADMDIIRQMPEYEDRRGR
jgi:hypothetical protein